MPNTETTNHKGIWNKVPPLEFSKNAVSTCHKKHTNTTYYDLTFLKYIGDNPFVITVHDMTYERLPEYFSGAEGTIQLKKEVKKI